MGAEILAIMDEGSGMLYSTEHDVVRNIAGDIESVRQRLAEALERAGYRVLNENPLQARRSATSHGAAACSNDVLDYQTTLTVGLKQAGPNTTRAIFDYKVKYTYLTRGDKQTLTREVEAIAAMANARSLTTNCGVCGAEISSSSRFCRQCGAPSVAASPAEIEVLNLTANTNTAYKSIYPGVIFVSAAFLLPWVLFLADSGSVKFWRLVILITSLAGAFGIIGLGMLINGLLKMRQALSPKPQNGALTGASPFFINAPETTSLPTQSNAVSVIEGTTDLLPQQTNKAKSG
jgi:hypothetical protein